MRHMVRCALCASLFGLALAAAGAATPNLDAWFLRATAFDAPGTMAKITAPDYIGGKDSRGEQSCYLPVAPTKSVWFLHNWFLRYYDRKHHIALAAPHDDVDGCAIFEAPTPPSPVQDGDLSSVRTARGLHIGSTYAQVLAVYGPPAKPGRHVVTSYSAKVPAVTVTSAHRNVLLPERITLVIDDGRVTSILISIDEAGLI